MSETDRETSAGEPSSDEPPSRASDAQRSLRYKVVETSVVTDEALENIINEWVSQGWAFDGIQFAMRESSKRPAMAFVLFTIESSPAASRDDSRSPVHSPTV